MAISYDKIKKYNNLIKRYQKYMKEYENFNQRELENQDAKVLEEYNEIKDVYREMEQTSNYLGDPSMENKDFTTIYKRYNNDLKARTKDLEEKQTLFSLYKPKKERSILDPPDLSPLKEDSIPKNEYEEIKKMAEDYSVPLEYLHYTQIENGNFKCIYYSEQGTHDDAISIFNLERTEDESIQLEADFDAIEQVRNIESERRQRKLEEEIGENVVNIINEKNNEYDFMKDEEQAFDDVSQYQPNYEDQLPDDAIPAPTWEPITDENVDQYLSDEKDEKDEKDEEPEKNKKKNEGKEKKSEKMEDITKTLEDSDINKIIKEAFNTSTKQLSEINSTIESVRHGIGAKMDQIYLIINQEEEKFDIKFKDEEKDITLGSFDVNNDMKYMPNFYEQLKAKDHISFDMETLSSSEIEELKEKLTKLAEISERMKSPYITKRIDIAYKNDVKAGKEISKEELKKATEEYNKALMSLINDGENEEVKKTLAELSNKIALANNTLEYFQGKYDDFMKGKNPIHTNPLAEKMLTVRRKHYAKIQVMTDYTKEAKKYKEEIKSISKFISREQKELASREVECEAAIENLTRGVGGLVELKAALIEAEEYYKRVEKIYNREKQSPSKNLEKNKYKKNIEKTIKQNKIREAFGLKPKMAYSEKDVDDAVEKINEIDQKKLEELESAKKELEQLKEAVSNKQKEIDTIKEELKTNKSEVFNFIGELRSQREKARTELELLKSNKMERKGSIDFKLKQFEAAEKEINKLDVKKKEVEEISL